jgi:hypothetical protein
MFDGFGKRRPRWSGETFFFFVGAADPRLRILASILFDFSNWHKVSNRLMSQFKTCFMTIEITLKRE